MPKAYTNPDSLAIPLHTVSGRPGSTQPPPHHPSATLLIPHTERRAGPAIFLTPTWRLLSLSSLWNLIILFSSFQNILTFHIFLSSQAYKAKGTTYMECSLVESTWYQIRGHWFQTLALPLPAGWPIRWGQRQCWPCWVIKWNSACKLLCPGLVPS